LASVEGEMPLLSGGANGAVLGVAPEVPREPKAAA
jgi:hypothetical protein